MSKMQSNLLYRAKEELETEYKKAVNVPWVRKPMSYALYELWKKWDRFESERERKICGTCHYWQEEVCCNADSPACADFRSEEAYCDEWVKNGKEDSV